MMKKISLMGIMILYIAPFLGMEPIGGHKERPDEQKERGGSLSQRSSGSNSKAVVSEFEVIDLEIGLRPQLKKDTIIVRSEEELEKILAERGLSLPGNENKRTSIVYVAKLDIDAIEREKTPIQGEEDFKEIVLIFKEHLKKEGKDISKIERRLVEKFKEIHSTPTNSPLTKEDASKLSQAQRAIEVLHKASIHQNTLRTQREQQSKISPKLRVARDPKAEELVGIVTKENPQVQSNMKVLEDVAFALLTEKLEETQESKNTTTWITAGVGVLGAVSTIGAAIITYLTTKKSC